MFEELDLKIGDKRPMSGAGPNVKTAPPQCVTATKGGFGCTYGKGCN